MYSFTGAFKSGYKRATIKLNNPTSKFSNKLGYKFLLNNGTIFSNYACC